MQLRRSEIQVNTDVWRRCQWVGNWSCARDVSASGDVFASMEICSDKGGGVDRWRKERVGRVKNQGDVDVVSCLYHGLRWPTTVHE
jgi:hypothetical protein